MPTLPVYTMIIYILFNQKYLFFILLLKSTFYPLHILHRKYGVGQKLKMTPQQQQQLSSSIYRLSLTQMFSDTVCLVF